MRKAILLFAVVFALATIAQAVNQTGTEETSVVLGVGGQTQTMSTSVVQPMTRFWAGEDSLQDGTGWIAIDTGRLAAGDRWIVEFDTAGTACVCEVRLITGLPDTVNFWADQYLTVYQAGDSATAKLITSIELKNPHTTTLNYAFFRGD
jgi:hypothetical protein